MKKLWESSFDGGDARIDDAFLRGQVTMYRSRAKFYQIISWLLLSVTGLLIAGGIYVFVSGDHRTNVYAEDEVRIKGELKDLHGNLSRLDVVESDASTEKQTITNTDHLMTILANTQTGLVSFATENRPELVDPLENRIKSSLEIIQACETDGEVKLITDSGEHVFSEQTIRQLNSAIGAESVDKKRLRDELVKTRELLAVYDNDPENEAANKEMNEYFRDKLHAVLSIDRVKTRVDSLVNDAKKNWRALDSQAADRGADKQRLVGQIADATEKLNEARQERQKILFMAWLPDLTLRIGTVILLLFLTQILLASYRYTVGISAFYLARGDALQLVEPVPNPNFYQFDTESANSGATGSKYRMADLALLTTLLSPASHRVDDVTAPSEHLVDIAKSWLTR